MAPADSARLVGLPAANGNLFYMAKADQANNRNAMPATNFVGGWLLEVDWDSNIVWEHINPAQHHDARRTESGGAIS